MMACCLRNGRLYQANGKKARKNFASCSGHLEPQIKKVTAWPTAARLRSFSLFM